MSNVSKIKKIAITGSIGSGKSTVSRYIRSKGFEVFDSDAFVHWLYREHEDLKNQIIMHFDHEMIEDDQVDTTKLRNFLIEHPDRRHQLESMVHPLVLDGFEQFVKNAKQDIVFAEVPLLFEAGWEKYFDQTWFVYADHDIIVDRLMLDRQIDEETLKSMMSWQMDPAKKSAMSSTILYNNKQVDSLYLQVDQALDKLK